MAQVPKPEQSPPISESNDPVEHCTRWPFSARIVLPTRRPKIKKVRDRSTMCNTLYGGKGCKTRFNFEGRRVRPYCSRDPKHQGCHYNEDLDVYFSTLLDGSWHLIRRG